MWVEVLTMAGRKDVLIVRVLLPIIIDLALRSKTQGRIEVLRMREHSVLEGMATRAEAFIRDFGLWSQVFSRYSYNARRCRRRGQDLAPNMQVGVGFVVLIGDRSRDEFGGTILEQYKRIL